MRPTRITMALLGVCTALVACGSTEPELGERRPDGVVPDGGPARLVCPEGLPGPRLVLIEAGETPFCIDARELSQGDYAPFIADIASAPPEQSEECAWNDVFAPLLMSQEREREQMCYPGADNQPCCSGYDPTVTPTWSMSCVDWCDARAYCAWAGKRLCGGLGGATLGVLDNTAPEAADPAKSEWQYACTNGGQTVFPYGDELEAGRCVDEGPDTDRKAGSETCTGAFAPYDGIQDMVGNLGEWTGDCEDGHCAVQGGYYDDVSRGCATYGIKPLASSASFATGFRCCADPVPE